LKVLIVGASRGLGLEFVRQYREAGAQVTATARDDAGLARLQQLGAKALRLDIADAAGSTALAWQIDGEAFDIVVINAGVGCKGQLAPDAPSAEDFDHVMHTNVLGPMRVLPQVVDALAPGARIVVVSSREGSMGLKEHPGGWLYRASKAAVNSVMRDAALRLAGKAIVVSVHPGWVRTDMGGPRAPLSPEASITALRELIDGLTAQHSGGFFNVDGTPLPW
jgi:NAD(P)-dependent dehydrogenase (short-subunit alcohol dehydrogenase family)